MVEPPLVTDVIEVRYISQLVASSATSFPSSVIPTISALRSMTIGTYLLTECDVSCYTLPADNGGGHYILIPSDTTSVDNGGTIIVDASGRRWYLQHNGYVSADHFGIDYTETVEVSAQLQNMFNVCQEAGIIPTLHANGAYKISTGLTLKQGRGVADTKGYRAQLQGNGAMLRPYGGITALSVIPRCLSTDYTTGRLTDAVNINGLVIDGYGATAGASALGFGATGYSMYCNEWGSVADIIIQNYQPGFILTKLQDVAHIVFDRICQKGWGTLFITSANTTGLEFCGDFVFNDCQFEGTMTNPPIIITAGTFNVNTSNMCRGIKFNNCDIYGAGTRLLVNGTGGCQVGDIWFSGVQWDGNDGATPDQQVIYLESNGTGSIFQVHIDEMYAVGFPGPVVYAVQNGSSTIKMCNITGGAINDCTASVNLGSCAIGLINVSGFTINGLTFDRIFPSTDPTHSAVILVSGSSNVQINNCTATNCSGVYAGVAVGNGSDHYIISSNIMRVNAGGYVVNDFSIGTPTRIVNNNIN